MKKKLLLFIVLLFVASWTLHAQASPGTPFESGMVGFNASLSKNLSGTGDIQDDMWIGIQIHLSSRIMLKLSTATFFRENSYNSGSGDNDQDRNITGSRIGFYYYFPVSSDFSVFLGSEFEFYRYKNDSQNASGTSDTREKTNLGALVHFGVQYMPWRQFGLVADISLGVASVSEEYKAYDNIGAVTTDRSDTTVIFKSVQATVGLVFYF